MSNGSAGWRSRKHLRTILRVKIEERPLPPLARNEACFNPSWIAREAHRMALLTQIQTGAEAQRKQLNEDLATELNALTAEEGTRWAELQSEWQLTIGPLYQADAAMNAATQRYIVPWDQSRLETWTLRRSSRRRSLCHA